MGTHSRQKGIALRVHARVDVDGRHGDFQLFFVSRRSEPERLRPETGETNFDLQIFVLDVLVLLALKANYVYVVVSRFLLKFKLVRRTLYFQFFFLAEAIPISYEAHHAA